MVAPRHVIWAAAAAALALPAACRPHSRLTAAEDSTFVHVMGDLRAVAASTTLDSVARAQARDSVLRHYQITPAALESLASRLASNPDAAVQLLRQVDTRARIASQPPAQKKIVPPTPAPVTTPPATPAAQAPAKPGAH